MRAAYTSRMPRRRPALSPADAMAARPVRAAEAELVRTVEGGKVTVPLRPPARWQWLYRLPAGATKTFELDAVGLFVWETIDGRTTVQQIVERVAERFRLNLRMAQVPTLQFLRTLMSKGLIGMAPESES